MPQLRTVGLSFIGRRAENQDSIITIQLGDNCHFLAVADGIGGAPGGARASRAVLKAAEGCLTKKFTQGRKDFSLKETLQEVYAQAQQAIAGLVADDSALSGMGTTLACVLLVDGHYVVGNIGDSRVYLFRGGRFYQVTKDHSYAQDYLETYGEPHDLMMLDQYSHFLTRAVDGRANPPDLFPPDKDDDTIKQGEGFLLCTDGLILDKMEADIRMIQDIFLGYDVLEKAAENMIAYASHAGSLDNITVVLAEYGRVKRKKTSPPRYPYPPDVSSPDFLS